MDRLREVPRPGARGAADDLSLRHIFAQRDMELRGPGDLFGTRQSGNIVIGVGTLAGDTQLLKTCLLYTSRCV